MKPNNKQRAAAVVDDLLILGVIAVVAWAVTPKTASGTNAHWWNPTTWGTHKPAEQVDLAKLAADAAHAAELAAKSQAVHAAHVEIHKASIAQESLPASRATDLDRRFTLNGMSLLDQVDPLTGLERSADVVLLQGLLAEETAKRIAAEQKTVLTAEQLASAQAKVTDAEKQQQAIEGQLKTVSEAATVAAATAKAKDTLLSKAEGSLRQHFETENGLANELRNETFLKRLGLGALVLICLTALYLRKGLGSVGSGLGALKKVLPADTYKTVVDTMDKETDWLHQTLIAAGRQKAQAVQAELEHALHLNPPENSPPNIPPAAVT